MDELKGYPKYQYSVFLKNGKDQQLVIRAETFEELVEAKKNIDKIMEVAEPKTEQLAKDFVGDTTKSTSPEDNVKCPMHEVEMPMRMSKAGNPYWSHSKQENGTWVKCFGKGWKS